MNANGIILIRYIFEKLIRKCGHEKVQLVTPPQHIPLYNNVRKRLMRNEKKAAKKEGKKEEDKPKEKVEEEGAAEDEKKPAKGDAKADADALQKMLDKALKNGGNLEMTPEMLEEMGGIEDLTKRLKEMAEKLGPEEFGKLMQEGMKMGSYT